MGQLIDTPGISGLRSQGQVRLPSPLAKLSLSPRFRARRKAFSKSEAAPTRACGRAYLPSGYMEGTV